MLVQQLKGVIKMKNYRTWLHVKKNVHDASGILHPYLWMWEKIKGIYYPAFKVKVYS